MITNEKIQKMLYALEEDLCEKIDDFYSVLDFKNPQKCKDAILAYIPDLIYQYQIASAHLASDVYRKLRQGIKKEFKIEIYIPETLESIKASVEYGCKYLFGEQDGS